MYLLSLCYIAYMVEAGESNNLPTSETYHPKRICTPMASTLVFHILFCGICHFFCCRQGLKMQFRSQLRFRLQHGTIALMRKSCSILWQKCGSAYSKTFPMKPFRRRSDAFSIHGSSYSIHGIKNQPHWVFLNNIHSNQKSGKPNSIVRITSKNSLSAEDTCSCRMGQQKTKGIQLHWKLLSLVNIGTSQLG